MRLRLGEITKGDNWLLQLDRALREVMILTLSKVLLPFSLLLQHKETQKTKKGINPAPVAAPDGRVEQIVYFDFGPEENEIRSTSSTRTRGKTKRKTKTATTATTTASLSTLLSPLYPAFPFLLFLFLLFPTTFVAFLVIAVNRKCQKMWKLCLKRKSLKDQSSI